MIAGEISEERHRAKRQPPFGALDMNVYDEVERARETYLCTQCGYQFPEDAAERTWGMSAVDRSENKVGLVFYDCKGDKALPPEQALTLPGLPVVLVLSHDSNPPNDRTSWRYGCTACVAYYVCDQILRSRQVVYTHVQGSDRGPHGMRRTDTFMPMRDAVSS